MRHPEYFNNVRRENICQEIGSSMKQSGAECKDRWAKVRNNHRKALQLRIPKSGQAAKKSKPPKYEQELKFLVPYIIDEDKRTSNFTTTISCNTENEEGSSEIVEEEDVENIDRDNLEDDDISEIVESPSIPRSSNFPMYGFEGSRASSASTSHPSSKNRIIRHPKRSRLGNPQQKTAATVLEEFLEKKQHISGQPQTLNDPLESFFMTMARTVKGFPVQDQIQIKKQIFHLVSDKEMDIVLKMSQQPSSTDPTTPQMQLQQVGQLADQVFTEKTNDEPSELELLHMGMAGLLKITYMYYLM